MKEKILDCGCILEHLGNKIDKSSVDSWKLKKMCDFHKTVKDASESAMRTMTKRDLRLLIVDLSLKLDRAFELGYTDVAVHIDLQMANARRILEEMEDERAFA